MAEIDDVIDLQIAIEDKAPEKPSFSVTLLADYHTAWIDYVHEYGDASELLSDGFDVDDAIYKMAVAVKSQDPSPATFKVGRLAHAYTHIVHLIPTVTAQGFVYSGTIDGVAFTYTVGAAATVKIIVEALIALAALTGITDITFTEDDTKVICTGDTPGICHSFDIGPGLKVIDVTADAGLAADLAAIKDEDNEWYGLALVPQSSAYVTAQALFVEANKKASLAQTADWDVIDPAQTNDVASDLVALALARTNLVYHRKIGGTEWLAAALLGKILTLDAGSYMVSYQTVAGVSIDKLQPGEISALAAKRVTKYTRINGQNLAKGGRTPSGRFLDITIFSDWLYATIQVDAFAVVTQNGSGKKLPYTAAGLSALKGSVEGSLAKGKKNPNPGLDPDFQSIVTIPGVAQQAQADRANRIVRGIEFEDRTSGGVESVVIRGRLSV